MAMYTRHKLAMNFCMIDYASVQHECEKPMLLNLQNGTVARTGGRGMCWTSASFDRVSMVVAGSRPYLQLLAVHSSKLRHAVACMLAKLLLHCQPSVCVTMLALPVLQGLLLLSLKDVRSCMS